MRRFDADYLRDTRRGMWEDTSALADLRLGSRDRVVDVGCGTGELSAVLRAETDATVVGVDADPDLLRVARDGPRSERATDADVGETESDPTRTATDASASTGAGTGTSGPFPVVRGDALSLPLRDDAADLTTCQALLVNLPEPVRAVAELARVSSDLVAAVEPDNAAVSVESTVANEAALERRARAAYLAGVSTDVTLGAAGDLFRGAGLSVVSTRRYDHVRTVEPPYDEANLRAARRKATGAGLADDRATMLAGGLSPTAYDDLRAEWRAMGRAVVRAMERGDYRRRETVPFHVTVGRVTD